MEKDIKALDELISRRIALQEEIAQLTKQIIGLRKKISVSKKADKQASLNPNRLTAKKISEAATARLKEIKADKDSGIKNKDIAIKHGISVSRLAALLEKANRRFPGA